jgi:hypothetical protein
MVRTHARLRALVLLGRGGGGQHHRLAAVAQVRDQLTCARHRLDLTDHLEIQVPFMLADLISMLTLGG